MSQVSSLKNPGRKTELLKSKPIPQGEKDYRKWIVPYGPSQTEFIIQQFQRHFPTSKITGRVKKWHQYLGPLLTAEHVINVPQVEKARQQHFNKRQAMIKSMHQLLLDRETKLIPSFQLPLNKLEASLYKGRYDYRFYRKYLPTVLPKAKAKPRKRSANKLDKKEKRKKEKKRTKKNKVTPLQSECNEQQIAIETEVNPTCLSTPANSLQASQLLSPKKLGRMRSWDPMLPKDNIIKKSYN